MLSEPPLRNPCNIRTILLHKPKVPIALNPNIRQLDPLGVPTCLPEVIDDAVIVPGMLRRLARERHIRHPVDIRERPWRIRLQQTRAVRGRILTDSHGLQILSSCRGGEIRQGRVGETPFQRRGAAAVGGVEGPQDGFEGDGGRFQVEVALD